MNGHVKRKSPGSRPHDFVPWVVGLALAELVFFLPYLDDVLGEGGQIALGVASCLFSLPWSLMFATLFFVLPSTVIHFLLMTGGSVDSNVPVDWFGPIYLGVVAGTFANGYLISRIRSARRASAGEP